MTSRRNSADIRTGRFGHASTHIRLGPAVRMSHTWIGVTFVYWGEIVAVLLALRAPGRCGFLKDAVIGETARPLSSILYICHEVKC